MQTNNNDDDILQKHLLNSVKQKIEQRYDSTKIQFPVTHDPTLPQHSFEFISNTDQEFFENVDDYSNDENTSESSSTESEDSASESSSTESSEEEETSDNDDDDDKTYFWGH